jgi:hypothetical protein
MNALAQTQSSSPDTPTTPQPPKALVEWLKRPDSAEEMAKSLIRSGRISVLEHALPALRHAASIEAGEAGVMSVLTAAFVHFPQPQRTPEEWAIFWQGYVNTCGHLSQPALLAGMQTWLADPSSQFLPKPGELRHLATQTPTEAHQLVAKARDVLDAVRAEQTRERIQADMAARGTDAKRQSAAIREMLAQTGAELETSASRQRAAMRGQGISHASRCRRPEGELTAAQEDVLRKCGVK